MSVFIIDFYFPGLAVRNAAPRILDAGKKLLKNIARKGLNASIGLASDAIRGKNMEQALENRIGEVFGNNKSKTRVSKNTRKRKQPTRNRSKIVGKKSRKSVVHKDIFS